MLKLQEGESLTFVLAVLVVVLTIVSIISGVYTHFGTVFYISAILTILIGFCMMYSISKLPSPKQKEKA